MLGLQIKPPFHRKIKADRHLLQVGDGVAVVHPDKICLGNGPYPFKQPSLNLLVKELHILAALLQSKTAEVTNKCLSQIGIVGQIGKGHLRLDHPELRGMASSVGVLGPEGGAKGVDITKGLGKQLTLQLTADGKAGLLGEEVMAEVNAAPFIAGSAVGGQGGDPEQLTGPFAVTGGDDRGMYVEEVAVGKKLMNRLSQF